MQPLAKKPLGKTTKLQQKEVILFGLAKRNLTAHQIAAKAASLNPAGLIAIFLAFSLGSVRAQFAGERKPGYLAGQTASVEFTSPDANATASGIPDWFQGVQRTSLPIEGDLHRITVSWSYTDNWLPGQETATRSATIAAGSYSETIEQAGVDNTYTFSIPSQRIDTDPVASEIEFRVYGNVGGSPFAMGTEAGWFTAGSSLRQNALIFVVPADDPQYGIRRVYSAIRLNVEGNHAPDAVTNAREAILRIGPPGEPGASLTVHQAGVDNTYQVILPPALPGGGGDEFVVVDAAISGSGYTHASGSPWLAVLPSRSYQTIAYPRTDGSGRFFDPFAVRAEDQGNDKTKWYEPRTGTILVQGKPYAIEQLGAGAKFESVSVESNSQVAISYRLGHQFPASFVALEYSLDGTAYTSIPLESCFGATGHLGEGVDPGVHSFVWDARGLVATLFEDEEVSLRVVATGGWQATSEAFTLERHCDCGDCPPGRVTAEARQSISIEIPLGADSLGRSFGRFRIHEETATAALGTPAVLDRQALNGARTFPANAKRPTQFLTPAILAEISDPDPNDQTWSLRFYDRATQLGPFVPGPGLYNQAAATPFQQITFSLVRTEGRFIQSFNVTETGIFGERTHAFPWTNPNLMSCRWDLRQTGPGIVPPPSAVRRESISEEVSPDGRIRTKDRRITSGDNVLASRSVSTSETFAFGTRRTRIERSIVQPDGSSSGSRSSFFVYEEDATKPGYGRITETYTDYDASWTAHRYNASGRSTILRPYRSAGRGSPEAALDVTRISKHTANFGLGPLEDHARITSRSLADEVVSRTVTISYQDVLGSTLSDGATPFNYREKWTIQVLDPDVVTAGEALASPVSLITRQRIYADGDFAGETRSLLFPDGTISIFEYKTDETIQWSGVPSADGRSITQGVRETETTNAFGQLVAYQAVAIPENLVIDEQVVLEQDELGRATKIRHLDGSISRRQYSCCGLISETGRDGVTTTHVRDHLGRLWSSTSLGKTTAYQLSPLGSVRSVTQSGGTLSIQRATRESDSLGIDRRATTPGNRVTRTVQSHDANGQRQETLTRPDGGTVVQRYFRDGRLQSVSGTATVPRRIEYGTEDHQAFRKEILLGDLGEEAEWVQTFTDMAGRVTRIVRSHESGVPAVATNHYNAKGQLVRTVDPDGVTLLFAYNDLGARIITAVDLNRNGIIDPAGPDRILSTERSWSTRGGKATRRSVAKVLTSTGSTSSADLVVTENSVEGWDIWNTVAGLTFHESTELEGEGNRTLTRTSPDGTREVTRITNGRIASLSRLAATGTRISLEEYGYDPLGRLVSATDTRTGATTLTWDENDQMVSLAEPGDRLTSFAYDAAGRIVQTVFPDGGVVVQGWTPLGLLQSQSGARTYPLAFAYDSQGRRTSMTTTAGITRWSYHPESGRLAGKLHPDQRGLTYTYTAAGRLARRTSARGIVTAYSYDAGGEVSLIDYSDATPDLTYQRDRIGQIIAVAQASGMTTSFQYAADLSGDVESESISGGPLHGITIDPGYDALQRRDRLLVSGSAGAPWSHAQSYAYDPAGRLSGIATAEQAFAYSYVTDSDLLGTTVSRTNGQPVLTLARMWDSKDRLDSVTSAAASGWGQQYTYHHNAADLRDRVTREDGSHREVAYDALGQVTGVTGRNQADQLVPGEEFRYTYNAIGNRLTARQGWAGNDTLTYVPSTGDGTQYGSISHPGLALVTGRADSSAVVTLDGQPVSQRQGDSFAQELRLENAAGPAARTITIAATRQGLAGSETETREAFVPAAVVTPEYDYDGNLTFDGWLEYTWDAENRLKTVKTRAGLSPPGSVPRDFRHAFTYDHAGRRIRRQTWVTLAGKEYPAADDLLVYDGWNQVAVLHGDTKQPRQTYTWGLDASQSLQGAGGVGGLLKLTDVATGTAHFPAYDGNGNLTALVNATTGAPTATYDYDPFGNLLQATGPFAENNPWRFSTKPVDDFTGQYSYGYRDYDPAQGRWLSRDPLGEAGGVNLYGFVGNRGEGWIDVLGRNVYAIDGTHANVNEVGAKWTYTNVADFVERVKLVGKEKASYYGGPGVRKNRNTPIGKTYHGITGAETYDIAREVKTQICQDLVRADNQNIDFVINLVAWSRGAVAAIWVAQMLEKEGCPCNGGTTFPRVNFLGLYDSVEMVFLPSDAPPLPFLFPATVGLQLLPDQPPPPGSIPSNVDHFFHAMKTGPSLIPGQVPLPTKRYGRAEEIAFPLRHPDPSSLSTHGDIGVDPYSTDAHTAMILRARGFGVSIDIFNLYNHYPRTSL